MIKKGCLVDETLSNGLLASTKNNNIEGAELLINNGAHVNEENILSNHSNLI